MPRKPQPVVPPESRQQFIVEVEGYDGDDGEIVVNNYRSANDPPFGAPDKVYCIGEMEADGVIRFHDWGYATAKEARDALRWREPAAGQPSASTSPKGAQ